MTLPAKLIAIEDERRGSPLGRLIRMLSSTRDGEILNTVRALQSLLNSAGSDIHAIAEHLESPARHQRPDEQDLRYCLCGGHSGCRE